MQKMILLALFLISFFSAVFAGDHAIEAYNKGNYKTAFKLYEKACDAGSCDMPG